MRGNSVSSTDKKSRDFMEMETKNRGWREEFPSKINHKKRSKAKVSVPQEKEKIKAGW